MQQNLSNRDSGNLTVTGDPSVFVSLLSSSTSMWTDIVVEVTLVEATTRSRRVRSHLGLSWWQSCLGMSDVPHSACAMRESWPHQNKPLCQRRSLNLQPFVVSSPMSTWNSPDEATATVCGPCLWPVQLFSCFIFLLFRNCIFL